MFWALTAKRTLTVKLHVTRRILRTGRAPITAVVQDGYGHTRTARKAVRF